MTGQVNVGVIGAGRIGRVHAENLAYRIPEANVVAVADVFVEAAEKLPRIRGQGFHVATLTLREDRVEGQG